MASWEKYFQEDRRGIVPPADLSFDTENPRFTPDKEPNDLSDEAIITYLDRTADLGELVQSIASSGYVDIEPLIVIVRNENLVVLEGNRRLAALKCLMNPELAQAAGVSTPEISESIQRSLQKVSVFKVLHQDEARNLIGFKHINGPQGWDAYAKALFAAKWLDDESAKGDLGLSLPEIAARMGDKHDTLYRIVSAVYVLQQAQSLEIFRLDNRVKRNFSFSHLYTALTYTEFREFIGLPRADRSVSPQRDPVSKEFYGNLQKLLVLLYGNKSENVEPVIKTQNPDLSSLKRVLGNAIARKVLLERHELSEALALTINGGDRFNKALIDALTSLRQAVEELTNADRDDETVEMSKDVRKRAIFIYSTLTTPQSMGD